MRRIAIAFVLCGALSGAAKADLLDGLIFGIKCAGADDTQECKARSKRDADESRERLRQSAGAADSTGPSGPTSNRGERADQCHTVKASGNADIDVAYVRGKSRFGFMTLDEKKHQTKGGYMRIDDDFKHTAVRGTLYDMWDRVSIKPPGGQRQWFYAGLRLMKAERSTELEARYCVKPSQLGMTAYLNRTFAGLVKRGK